MNTKLISIPNTKIVDLNLIASLLDGLHRCFSSFQDGIVNGDTFVGGLPLTYLNADGSLGALTLEESRQIRQALMEPPSQSRSAGGFSLQSLVNWMHFLKASDEKPTGDRSDRSDRAGLAIIGSDGRILPLPAETNLNTLIQDRLNELGLSRFSAYWHAIREKLEAKRLEEIYGDLSLIDSYRRKLIAKRLNATPFERAAQEFAAQISMRFCDANGDIVSPDSLEKFVSQLVDCLLEKTKPYWPIAPLLSLFDAVVVPVLRPMLYPHITWTSENNIFSTSGAFDIRQFTNKRTSFETTPNWSSAAQQQTLHFVEEALKHHLSLRFFGWWLFDAFSTYNREIHSSVHIDPSGFNGKIKTFGPPVHVRDVMQLIQPVPKKPEEKILDRVMTYRSAEEGVWY